MKKKTKRKTETKKRKQDQTKDIKIGRKKKNN